MCRHYCFNVMTSNTYCLVLTKALSLKYMIIDDFLYVGIDNTVRKKMELIKFSESWQDKIMEWKFNKGETGARYGMMAFGKSADGKEIDCMYILYKMDFKVAPKVTVTTKDKSILLGLFEWSITDEKTESSLLGSESKKRFQNYFRLKAMEGFCSEGVIEKVGYVD